MSKLERHTNRVEEKSGQKAVTAKYFINMIVLVVIFGVGFFIGQGNLSSVGIFNGEESVQKADLPKKLNYSGVEELYDGLRSSFDGQLDQNTLEEGLKQGLVKAAGDPYTEYLNEEATKDFEDDLSGSFEGIGAELGKDKESIVIISPINGFPAEKAGLKAKDIIVEINKESAYDITITEAVKKIRGEKGSVVNLGIVRGDKRLDFEIIRDRIDIPSVTSEVVDKNIGVIKISRFGTDTVELTNKVANDLKDKNVKGIILDLRGNPGGLLDGAVDVSDLWLNEGKTILQEKRDNKVIKTYFAKSNPILGGIKTVVLINEGSASASEIVAGALKDNKVATIIGVKSYGKGSVQEVKELDFGGSLKVTIARWFTPDGRNIDKEGIEPDKKIELKDADIIAKRDPQKTLAIKFLNQ